MRPPPQRIVRGPARSSPDEAPERGECLPGVERDIKRVEAAFNTFWLQRDPIAFGGLWSELGDMVHGDGTIERGRRAITQNRTAQFKAPEYKYTPPQPCIHHHSLRQYFRRGRGRKVGVA